MKNINKLIALALLSAAPAFAAGANTSGNNEVIIYSVGGLAVVAIIFAILHVRKKNKED